jgi:hypothetical protein
VSIDTLVYFYFKGAPKLEISLGLIVMSLAPNLACISWELGAGTPGVVTKIILENQQYIVIPTTTRFNLVKLLPLSKTSLRDNGSTASTVHDSSCKAFTVSATANLSDGITQTEPLPMQDHTKNRN